MSMHYNRRKSPSTGLLTAIFIAVALVLIGIVAVTVQNVSKSAQNCTVADKHMTTDVQDGKSVRVYQVETRECGVLRIEDNAFQGVFNSADLFAAVQPGQRYRFTTVGWRIPFLSQFPTVTKVESA